MARNANRTSERDSAPIDTSDRAPLISGARVREALGRLWNWDQDGWTAEGIYEGAQKITTRGDNGGPRTSVTMTVEGERVRLFLPAGYFESFKRLRTGLKVRLERSGVGFETIYNVFPAD